MKRFAIVRSRLANGYEYEALVLSSAGSYHRTVLVEDYWPRPGVAYFRKADHELASPEPLSVYMAVLNHWSRVEVDASLTFDAMIKQCGAKSELVGLSLRAFPMENTVAVVDAVDRSTIHFFPVGPTGVIGEREAVGRQDVVAAFRGTDYLRAMQIVRRPLRTQ